MRRRRRHRTPSSHRGPAMTRRPRRPADRDPLRAAARATGASAAARRRSAPQALARLASDGAALMGTSHRQAPVRALVGARPRRACASCSRCPTATRSRSATAARPRSGRSPRSASSRERSLPSRQRRVLQQVRRGHDARRRSSPTRSSLARRSPARARRDAGPPRRDADVLAWAHNETSTGVMIEVRARPTPATRSS